MGLLPGWCFPRWPGSSEQEWCFCLRRQSIFMAHDSSLDPMDFDMVGVLGQVSGTIRSGGTGEIIFEQEGARKACAARSEARRRDPARRRSCGHPRYDHGVAYVRRWSELAEKAGVAAGRRGEEFCENPRRIYGPGKQSAIFAGLVCSGCHVCHQPCWPGCIAKLVLTRRCWSMAFAADAKVVKGGGQRHLAA